MSQKDTSTHKVFQGYVVFFPLNRQSSFMEDADVYDGSGCHVNMRASLTFIVHFFLPSISSSIHVLLSFLGISDSLCLGDRMI